MQRMDTKGIPKEMQQPENKRKINKAYGTIGWTGEEKSKNFVVEFCNYFGCSALTWDCSLSFVSEQVLQNSVYHFCTIKIYDTESHSIKQAYPCCLLLGCQTLTQSHDCSIFDRW